MTLIHHSKIACIYAVCYIISLSYTHFLREMQPPCILYPASAETLMGAKEGLHLLGKGQCIFMEPGTIGYPSFGLKTFRKIHLRNWKMQRAGSRAVPQASLVDKPLLWAGRLCIFYALLKIGIAGPQANLLSGIEEDQWMPKWLQNFLPKGSETQQANDRRKMVGKWHATTKGTLKRSYRVPIKSEGRRLLKAIASLLSDDDTFRDATSHKGCQIRRENAHGESVCCNNVRALFDELPTPHLVVEITPFPAGPLSEPDYLKAEKIEKVLRTGASI